nr:PREDICTED: putative sodium-dependent excitatory amino acid transporter glt-6 [Bemisia tabaci]XP_018900574.1 PREDICTED: putative sodium-dependent excitatory amino acid transporter glt-6 [Bemisia tabaci]
MTEEKDDKMEAQHSEEHHKRPIKNKIVEKLKKNAFLISTLTGVILGAILGFILRPQNLTADTVTLISYPGELFMRTLKLLVLPFVITCIIIGTASLNIQKNGKIAVRTLAYFFSTSMLNVVIGMILVLLIHPGSSGLKPHEHKPKGLKPQVSILDGFLDIGRNLLPDNLFLATLETTYTKYDLVPGTNGTYKKIIDTRAGTDMIGIVVFCMMFGSILGTLGSKRQIVIDFFSVIYDVLMKLLLGVIWCTPVCVGSIICGKIASIPDISSALDRLAWFILTVLVALALYHFIIIQLIYFFFLRKNPFKYYVQLGPSLLTAFATSSKAASLPITFKVLEDEVKMNKRITRFVLPLGNLNLNGTAAFMTIGVIFIAQMNNMPLGIGDYVNLLITVTFLSMSMATIPSASLIIIVMLCNIIHAPVEDVSLLFAVDWLLDRARTVNNILGDCYTIAVVQKLSEKELAALEQEESGKLMESEHTNETNSDGKRTQVSVNA